MQTIARCAAVPLNNLHGLKPSTVGQLFSGGDLHRPKPSTVVQPSDGGATAGLLRRPTTGPPPVETQLLHGRNVTVGHAMLALSTQLAALAPPPVGATFKSALNSSPGLIPTVAFAGGGGYSSSSSSSSSPTTSCSASEYVGYCAHIRTPPHRSAGARTAPQSPPSTSHEVVCSY